MTQVDETLRPASSVDEALLRQQARENLRRTIDIWLARTAAGGSPVVARHSKMLRSKSEKVEPLEVN